MDGREYIEEASSGRYARWHVRRIARIEELAAANGVSLAQVRVVVNRDYRWNQRANRTASEAKAVRVGQTNDNRRGYPHEIVWAFVEE